MIALRTAIVTTLLASLLAAFAAVWGFSRLGRVEGAAVDGSAAATGRLRGELRELAERLEDERIAREQLAAEVALLRSVLDYQAQASAEEIPVETPDAAAPAQTRILDDTSVAAITTQAQRRGSSSNFDVASLVATGVSQGEAEELQTRWERNELEKLYLADQASREGWLFTPRYGDESASFDTDLRSEMGDARWDQMLFAAGRPNRVVVSGVLGGSAAARAGIQKGDEILSYGDSRIFAPAELREATRAGESGETVRVEILRGEQRQVLYLPRGPVGALIGTKKAEPQG